MAPPTAACTVPNPIFPPATRESSRSAKKNSVLDEVNRIRDLLNLEPVFYNNSYDAQTVRSALITAANKKLSHYPDESYLCYSAEGYEGASTSNLYMANTYGQNLTDSAEHIRVFLIDDQVENLGHRRWLLYPFLKYVSYGRVDGVPAGETQGNNYTGGTLKVIFDEKQDLSGTNVTFVPYPCGNFPTDLVDLNWYWSFSVIVDKSNASGNSDVDYSNAVITVTDENDNQMTVASVSYNSQNYGLPNIIKWLVRNIQTGHSYHVKISGVVVDGSSKTYEYDVKITDSSPGGCDNFGDGQGSSGGLEGSGGGGCFLNPGSR